MGYQIYKVGKRWGGYGVPAICEHPDCKEKIDRGVSYACGGEPFSERGCDRYFCGKHLYYVSFNDDGEACKHTLIDCDCDDTVQLCDRCKKGESPFDYKPEVKKWVKHLLTDESWAEWRKENPEEVTKLKQQLQ